MKQLTCNDASPEGAPSCDFVATGETDGEVMQKMRDHAGSVHADMMASATPESMKEWEATTPAKITEAE